MVNLGDDIGVDLGDDIGDDIGDGLVYIVLLNLVLKLNVWLL